MERKLTITDNAKAKIKQLAMEQAVTRGAHYKLRIKVEGGGCSGFKYSFILDDVVYDDDFVFGDVTYGVAIDELSLNLVAGSILDYVEDLGGAGFIVRNPNASAKCGCGSSFAI